MNVLIKSATIISPKSAYHQSVQDLLIENGILKKIAPSIKNTSNYKVVEFPNLHVSIGWFDGSVSFGEPGFEERETIEHGLQVAAKSGFTGIALNSATNPVVDNKSIIEFLVNKSEKTTTKLYPIGSLTKNAAGTEITELYDLKNSGAVAYNDYKKGIDNANLLKIALLYAQSFDGLVMSYPQNSDISGDGLMNESEQNTLLGLKGIPNFAEELHIMRDLAILKYTGGKLHIPTISTAESVKLIKQAKSEGLNVTCSVSINNLLLTDDVLDDFNTNYKLLPPLRTKTDQKALLKGIKYGVIDFIVSDHCPIDIEHKKVEFQQAKFGSIGLESFFGALNTVLDLNDFINQITINPREIFKLEIPEISIEKPANLTLFNPIPDYTFNDTNILSTSKNSAMFGQKLKGIIYGVLANNQLILNQ